MMSSTTRRALVLGGVLAVLALLAWVELRSGPTASPVASPVPASKPQLDPRDEPPGLATKAGEFGAEGSNASREPVAAANLAADASALELCVRSALALPLSQVDVRAGDGLWRPHDCRLFVASSGVVGPSRATLRGLAPPFDVRAPGHAPLRVDGVVRASGGAIDIVLQPDALLVIEDPLGLFDEAEPPVRPSGAPWLDQAILATHGRLADGSWALALASERVTTRGDSELELALPLHDGEALLCKLRHAPGLRARAKLPEELAQAGRADLSVRVGPHSPRSSGPWSLRLVDAPAPAQSWIRSTDSDEAVGELRARARPLDTTVESARGEWTFAALNVGRDYSYAAFDRASGASAIGALRHSGEPLELTLRGGCGLSGKLSVPAGSALPARVDLGVYWNAPPSRTNWTFDASIWNALSLPARPLASDGSFESACFDALPEGYDDRALLSVTLYARGFRRARWSGEVSRAARYDVGVVALVPLEPAFVLASPRDVTSWDREHCTVHRERLPDSVPKLVSTAPNALNASLSSFAVSDWVQNSDGSLAVYVEDEGAALLHQPWTPPDSLALVCALPDRAPRVLYAERGPDGRYHPLPTERHRVSIEYLPQAGAAQPWKLHLRWRGIWLAEEAIRAGRAGDVWTRDFEAPTGAELVWVPQLDAGWHGLMPNGPPTALALVAPPDGAALRVSLR
jgi:hypothetical protein